MEDHQVVIEVTLPNRDYLPRLFTKMGLLGKGVEVGVQRGQFSQHILKNWNGKLYMVDTWAHIAGYDDIANEKSPYMHLQCMAQAFISVYDFERRAVLIREASLEASKMFLNRSLDFVYIDAAHDYESVRKDLMAWEPKVKNGGILCGHDFVEDGVHPGCGEFGVKRAVIEFAHAMKTNVEITGEQDFPSWVIKL